MMRKILQWILPKKHYQRLVDESKRWFFVHGACGYSVSVWEAGGIRFGAMSKNKKVLGKCPRCDKKVFFDLTEKE
jgi:hypothetical protein